MAVAAVAESATKPMIKTYELRQKCSNPHELEYTQIRCRCAKHTHLNEKQYRELSNILQDIKSI